MTIVVGGCGVDSYLKKNGVQNYTRDDPMGEAIPFGELLNGPVWYKGRRGTVTFAKGNLVSEILYGMIVSSRTFVIRDFSLEQLKLHVLTRESVVAYAKKAQFQLGSAASPFKLDKNYWSGLDLKAGVRYMDAVNHAFGEDSKNYQMGCLMGSRFVMNAGIGWVIYNRTPDNPANPDQADPRVQVGNPLKSEKKIDTMSVALASDWIPGDWGYIWNPSNPDSPYNQALLNKNLARPPRFEEGENIIYLGADKYWGVGAGVPQSLSDLCNWVGGWAGYDETKVQSTWQKEMYDAFRSYPAVGLAE
jgi:hypothetical protein